MKSSSSGNIIFRLTLMCLIAVVLISCEKELDLNITNFTPRINVISEFSNDSTWNIHLSPTKKINESNLGAFISDAIVTIKDLDFNIEYELEHIGEGNYSAGARSPFIGHRYELHVTALGFESIYATSTVPEYVALNVQISDREESNNESGLTKRYFDINLSDTLSEQNYYIFEFERKISEIQDPVNDPEDEDPIVVTTEFNEPVKIEELNRSSLGVFLDDSQFNGGTFSIELDDEALASLTSTEDSTTTGNSELGIDYYYEVKVKTVSEELFLYKKYLEDRNNKNPINSDINVLDNIENGTGIFGAYNQQVIILK